MTSSNGNLSGVAAAATRDILADNLRRLIARDARPGERLSIRAWAMGRGLDVRLIDRLTKRKHAVTLDKLEELAAAVNMEPWQLLFPDLDPSSPPDAPISNDERQVLARLRRLLSEP